MHSRYLTALSLLLLTLTACRSGPDVPEESPTAAAAQLHPEEERVVRAIASLDSMRIARSASIRPGDVVDTSTFARVCKPVGMRARELSRENGWAVRQIATRYRNPANAAGRDSAYFAAFESDPGLVARWVDVTEDGVAGRHYLRRIAVQQSCLACHGARDDRPDFVRENYPEDLAYGFRPGDLRGLYSVFVADSLLREPPPTHTETQPIMFFSRFTNRTAPDRLLPRDFVTQRDTDAPVLDVLTPGEYAGGHLTGALNVDVGASDFQERIEALTAAGTLERDAPVYLYCRSGNRSGMATRQLQQMGFSEATNVGGFQALRSAGAEVAP